MSTEYFRDLVEEEPMKLKDGEFKVWASFSTADYDNDDNPYARIYMEYLSNMET
jgi:hypothetical protein